MSWLFHCSPVTWIQSFCVNVVKTGHVPKHVAFIMDGNRRFAVINRMEKLKGHLKGFEKLRETRRWCLELGIFEVTFFTFSIENFKRSQEEVACLMSLAKFKIQELLDDRDTLEKEGVRIRVIGNLTLLPEDLQSIIAEVMLITRTYNKFFLNIALAYTAREEMSSALAEVAAGLRSGELLEEDVSECLVGRCLHSSPSPEPELLIRTSGETRLSDFMLWQTAYSCIYFTPVLWPEFSIWTLLKAVFYYQRCYPQLQVIRVKAEQRAKKQDPDGPSTQQRVEKFLGRLEQQHLDFGGKRDR